MPSATGSLGAASPGMCRLSPWTPLITAPEAVVGRSLESVSPGTRLARCGRALLMWHVGFNFSQNVYLPMKFTPQLVELY